MKNGKIERMVGVALLMAMVIVLQYIGSLIPPIGGTVSISLVLIPIVMGASIYGAAAGAILGLTFAAVTLINCINGSDIGGAMVFQSNPVLCIAVVIAKSVLCGMTAAWVHKLLYAKNPYIAMLCAAIVCPVVNTGIFITCLVLFFKPVLSAWANGSDLLTYVLTSLVLCNFLPELILNIVFSPAGCRIRKAVMRRK